MASIVRFASIMLNSLIILLLSSSVHFKWTLVKKFSINSVHLLGLPSNLSKRAWAKLHDSNPCCNAKVGLMLICDMG